MVVFAKILGLDIDWPYAQYWLPLLIGAAVGVCALAAGKLAFGARAYKKPLAKPDDPKTAEHDPFTQGSSTEHRQTFRRQGNPTEVLIAYAGQKDRPTRGFVLDRSTGGICLLVTDEAAAGIPLSVLPVSAPEMTPWVDVEVRSCRAAQDGFELGCQFIKTPNWSVLLMFG